MQKSRSLGIILITYRLCKRMQAFSQTLQISNFNDPPIKGDGVFTFSPAVLAGHIKS